MAKKVKNPKKIYKPEDSLNHAKNTKVRGEFIDYDYADKLDPENTAYLAKFNNEYYGAAISKRKDGKVKAGHLHKDLKQVKDIYDSNNRRNNDVLGVSKANRLINDIDAEIKNNDGWYVNNTALEEDALNEGIDSQEQEFLTREEYEKVKENLTIEMQFFYEAYFSENMELEGNWDDET